jgi:group I intron endonuclease
MGDYTVYRHIAPNGKMYVGVTMRDPAVRWQNGSGYPHNEYFSNAINKYGWDSFKHETLLRGLTAEEASEAEKIFIECWDLTNPEYGYNLASGGLTFFTHNDLSKKKMSMQRKGKKFSEEHKRKISEAQRGEKNHMYGKHLSEETKQKIREKHMGKNNHFYGKSHTLESRKKISQAKQNISDETRAKMSKSAHKIPIVQLDKNTLVVLNVFESAREAERRSGVRNDHICECCKHKAKSAGGYIWRYYEEYNKEKR